MRGEAEPLHCIKYREDMAFRLFTVVTTRHGPLVIGVQVDSHLKTRFS